MNIIPRRSEDNGMSSLTFKQAERIRRRYENGATPIDLAAMYGVSRQTIDSIVKGKTYTEPPSGRFDGTRANQNRSHR